MNCSIVAGSIVAYQLLSEPAVHCSQDWPVEFCPLELMLDLIESGVRFIFIAVASAALAIAGIILSLLAHMKRLLQLASLRTKSQNDALPKPPSTRFPRDRDTRPLSPRKDRAQNNASKALSLSPRRAERAAAPIPTPPATPVRSLWELPRAKEQQQSRPSRGQRPRKRMSGDSVTPLPPLSESPLEVRATEPALVATSNLLSDSSQSPDRSMVSLSSDEHSPLRRSHVLQKIRDHHSHLRERCLNRSQSLPIPKVSRPARRTDPYQAPYYFPTPLSPDAGTYLQEVVNERHLVGESLMQRDVPLSPPTSPLRQSAETSARHTSMHSSASHPVPRPANEDARHGSIRRHRWSWHISLPHHHSSERGRSVESHRRRDGGATAEKGMTEHKEMFSRLRFGHHRRRHGTGSEDARIINVP